MTDINTKKLGTEPYKGVRDFFPEDMFIEQEIFSIWRNIAQKYGYEEYGASVLEPADLYKAKSGDELVNEQTYTFKDRGDREVTLRPEMTPTLARMISAKKRELNIPIRWYSIPNLFRYEQPQRGRTREHWQLNVDIFGVESLSAEVEIINLACDIVRTYGLKDTNFEIRLNNRKLVNYIVRDVFGFDQNQAKNVCSNIDKKDKLPAETFKANIEAIFAEKGAKKDTDKFIALLNSKNISEFFSNIPSQLENPEANSDLGKQAIEEINQVIEGLANLGITNVRFDQTLMRGFDYYTGIVFEIFDLNPVNKRSVFGGGRYDDLLSLFGNEKLPAVGFGAGDLIARDLMETYGTLPKKSPVADLTLCTAQESSVPYALDVAQSLREQGLKVSVDFTTKKIGDKIGNADKRNIPRIIVIGDEEMKTGNFKLKTLSTGEEIQVSLEEIVSKILNK